MGVLFVLSPTRAFTAGEARRLTDYLAGGGVVVYAAEDGDPQLDFALKVVRQNTITGGRGVGAGPMLGGVSHVAGAAVARSLVPGPDQVVVLRSETGQPLAVEQFVGRGRMVALIDPLPLCNGYLLEADNWRLASDLVSLAPAEARVAFDEYHHGTAGLSSPLTGWLSTAWGAATAWVVLACFLGLLLRGRAFGPRLELPGGGPRSTEEHLAAAGGLLQRSRAAAATGRLLAAATRRTLAARHGLVPGPGFESALRRRAPMDAAELERAEADLGRPGVDEAGLLSAARRLHRLAYPDQPRS
jgi:uncharacterized protein DUF4350